MKTLYLDCTHGARKDALVSYLFDMLPREEQLSFASRFSRLGLGGISLDEVMRPEPHHEHHHDHHALDEVRATIAGLAVAEAVKASALGVYDLLAEAEAKAHGVSVADVHFHEVGNAHAIASIVAYCLLMDELAPEEVVASPITTGFGFVDCAHGRLPIPAPATANVLAGLPTRQGEQEDELTTPTGAAMVRFFADRFEEER